MHASTLKHFTLSHTQYDYTQTPTHSHLHPPSHTHTHARDHTTHNIHTRTTTTLPTHTHAPPDPPPPPHTHTHTEQLKKRQQQQVLLLVLCFTVPLHTRTSLPLVLIPESRLKAARFEAEFNRCERCRKTDLYRNRVPHTRRLILLWCFSVWHVGQRAVCQKMIKGTRREYTRRDNVRGKGGQGTIKVAESQCSEFVFDALFDGKPVKWY